MENFINRLSSITSQISETTSRIIQRAQITWGRLFSSNPKIEKKEQIDHIRQNQTEELKKSFSSSHVPLKAKPLPEIPKAPPKIPDIRTETLPAKAKPLPAIPKASLKASNEYTETPPLEPREALIKKTEQDITALEEKLKTALIGKDALKTEIDELKAKIQELEKNTPLSEKWLLEGKIAAKLIVNQPAKDNHLISKTSVPSLEVETLANDILSSAPKNKETLEAEKIPDFQLPADHRVNLTKQKLQKVIGKKQKPSEELQNSLKLIADAALKGESPVTLRSNIRSIQASKSHKEMLKNDEIKSKINILIDYIDAKEAFTELNIHAQEVETDLMKLMRAPREANISERIENRNILFDALTDSIQEQNLLLNNLKKRLENEFFKQ